MKLPSSRPLIILSLLVTLAALSTGAEHPRPVTRGDLLPRPTPFTLAFPGDKGPVPYEKFGTFTGVGTKDYRYVIENKAALSKAAGEGIFPNTKVIQDPRYRELLNNGSLEGHHWKFVDLKDSELSFYKWASTNEDPGVKQFYTAIMLERLGLTEEAVKAFYAVVVHFPKTVSYTYFKTPWYIGPAAMDRLQQLLRRKPEIKMEYVGGSIKIKNGFDTDTKNDVFAVDPGKLVAVKKRVKEKQLDMSKMAVIKTVGGPQVQLKEYQNHQWQLFVEGKPFQIRAITYYVTPVGTSPDRGTYNPAQGWQLVDTDKNGIHDGFFESFIDKSADCRRSPNQPAVGDAVILRDLGVNTIRSYHHLYNKELFRKLHKDFGLYFIGGDLMGVYAVGSGADWNAGPSRNAEQRKKMLDGVRSMVEEYKSEPYVLMWMLGNENDYGVANNSQKNPHAYYSLINEAAKMVHEIDPSRPVGLCNGDVLFLDVIQAECPDIDLIGINAYRGEQGFGRQLFSDIKDYLDKPVMISEYGTSAYAEGFSTAEAEGYQAMYDANNWEDIEANMAGRGVGNALGGVLFEFMDEWWKANSDLPEYVQKEKPDWYAPRSATYKNLQPENHDTVPQFGAPFLDGWSYEEWYGLISQGNGHNSPFCRVMRPAYYTMRDMWKN